MSEPLILGTPFITLLYPFQVNDEGVKTTILGNTIFFPFIYPLTKKEIHQVQSDSINKNINLIQRKKAHINYLSKEIQYKKVDEQLLEDKVKKKIKEIQDLFQNEICSDLPNAFWSRKKHEISLPYIQNFDESKIPTKARPIQMNEKLLEYCKQEIDSLLKKKLIRPSKSPWSCAAFYVQNAVEIERGAPRLVINYKPLNKVLQWIRYPIPNKQDLLKRLHSSVIYSKFDMKSGFWQVQIREEDRYKTAFTVPFGHYEWNVMPFGLKNALSEFQNYE